MLSFVLLLFVCLLSILMFQDGEVLVALWRESPILYSFVYAASAVFIVSGVAGLIYWKLRPKLWKQDPGRRPT